MTALGQLTRALPDAVISRLLPADRRFDPAALPPTALPFGEGSRHRVLIGAENAAGQGAAWAHSVKVHLPEVDAVAVAVDRGSAFGHAVDRVVPAPVFAWSRRWQSGHRRAVLSQATHVLLEGGRPLFAGGIRGDAIADARRIVAAQLGLAYVWHGSDIRDPDAHARRTPESPFRTGAVDRALVGALRDRVAASRRLISRVDAPSFVSTPDLLIDLPDAHWLPIVIDPIAWRSETTPMDGRRRPVVVHAPSRAALKGSSMIDPVLTKLSNEGLIDYRRLAGVPNAMVRNIVRDADIVVDQLGLGSYGVLACEALAAGRIVMGDPSDHVRSEIAARTGQSVPITGTSGSSLERSIRRMCADPTEAVTRAAQGPGFVADVHDGRRSAAVIASVCGIAPGSDRMEG